MADEPQEKLKDNAIVQEFITAYLYGLYTLKRGRLSPADAIKHVLAFASMAENVSVLGKSLGKFLHR